MSKPTRSDRLQFAALPIRHGEGGRREVMLLTSRETRRWVIPKGWPMKGKKPHEVAAQEAFEEAGLIGHVVGKRPIGSFRYEKRLAKKSIPCEVEVFLFHVTEQADHWPEKEQRETRWFDATEAAGLVFEGGLSVIIHRISGSSHRHLPHQKG